MTETMETEITSNTDVLDMKKDIAEIKKDIADIKASNSRLRWRGGFIIFLYFFQFIWQFILVFFFAIFLSRP